VYHLRVRKVQFRRRYFLRRVQRRPVFGGELYHVYQLRRRHLRGTYRCLCLPRVFTGRVRRGRWRQRLCALPYRALRGDAGCKRLCALSSRLIFEQARRRAREHVPPVRGGELRGGGRERLQRVRGGELLRVSERERLRRLRGRELRGGRRQRLRRVCGGLVRARGRRRVHRVSVPRDVAGRRGQ